MKEKLIKTELPLLSKRLSLISAIFFLIGSLYYSYIHIKSAYTAMCKMNVKTATDGSMAYKLEFSFSNLNALAIFSVLLVLIMFVLTVLLIVFAMKNKHHILSAILSASIILLQFAIRKYTMLQEFMFARYVLGLGNSAYNIGVLCKYIPFAVALILSVVCFAVNKYELTKQ